jgi:hypothetical protein
MEAEEELLASTLEKRLEQVGMPMSKMSGF